MDMLEFRHVQTRSTAMTADIFDRFYTVREVSRLVSTLPHVKPHAFVKVRRKELEARCPQRDDSCPAWDSQEEPYSRPIQEADFAQNRTPTMSWSLCRDCPTSETELPATRRNKSLFWVSPIESSAPLPHPKHLPCALIRMPVAHLEHPAMVKQQPEAGACFEFPNCGVATPINRSSLPQKPGYWVV